MPINNGNKAKAVVEPTPDGYWVWKLTDDKGMAVFKSERYLSLPDAVKARARHINAANRCDFETKTELPEPTW